METNDILEKVISTEKEKRLSFSRVPAKTKAIFIQIAKEEFEDDYGLTLKFLLDQALEYQDMKVTFFENINMKLDSLLQSQSLPGQKEEEFVEKKMMSGKIIKYKKEVPNKWVD